MIFVEGTSPIVTTEACEIIPLASIRAPVPFDATEYERLEGKRLYDFYLELFEMGFRKASTFKELPLPTLLDLLNEFRMAGYMNAWLHRKAKFNEADIEVSLTCHFTTQGFKLIAAIRSISSKLDLCAGVVLETEPDEVFFENEFKDVLIDDKNIIITDVLDRPRFLIDIRKAQNFEFVVDRLPDSDRG